MWKIQFISIGFYAIQCALRQWNLYCTNVILWNLLVLKSPSAHTNCRRKTPNCPIHSLYNYTSFCSKSFQSNSEVFFTVKWHKSIWYRKLLERRHFKVQLKYISSNKSVNTCFTKCFFVNITTQYFLIVFHKYFHTIFSYSFS